MPARQCIERNCRVAPAPAPPAPSVSRLVDRDPINPGSQVRLASEAADALKRPQKSFLCQVASFFAVFSQTVEQTIDFARALVNQLLEGRASPRLQSFNELCLGTWAAPPLGSRVQPAPIPFALGGLLALRSSLLPPGAGIGASKICPFPDRHLIGHRHVPICSQKNFIALI